MNSKNIKKGLCLVTVTGVLLISGETVSAEDTAQKVDMPRAGIESVLNDYHTKETALEIDKYLVPSQKSAYADLAFTNVLEGSYLYIRSNPSTDSEWVGKLYKDSAAKITGPVGEWTSVTSGSVSGYVKTEYIITGNQAEDIAAKLVEAAGAKTGDDVFRYAESKEEEQTRLQQEAEAKALEDAQKAEETAETTGTITSSSTGQAVVDYACQFIGNPYVWGGTSLTNGADCSGFIQTIYANFGVSMPRTSGEMRSAGVEVSYDQAVPGDVICYNGHVGIYIGDGKIVNAIDEAHGIGISNANMMNIITVRRLI